MATGGGSGDFGSGAVSVQFRKIENNFEKFTKDLLVRLPDAMLNALTPTFLKALEYCPVDTGAMRDSGYLEVTDHGKSPRVEIGFGRGGEPTYTALVHENVDAFHEAPTQAKWLERAVEEDEGDILSRIATELEL